MNGEEAREHGKRGDTREADRDERVRKSITTGGDNSRCNSPGSFPFSARQQAAILKQMDYTNCEDDANSTSGSSTPTRRRVPKVLRRNERGETALHVAARRGDANLCQKLIAEGANVNETDYAGWTPLHEACTSNKYNAAKLLIENGASVNVASNQNGTTPLHDAAARGYADLVWLLLKSGANRQKRNGHDKSAIELCQMSSAAYRLLESQIIPQTCPIDGKQEYEDIQTTASEASTPDSTKININEHVHGNLLKEKLEEVRAEREEESGIPAKRFGSSMMSTDTEPMYDDRRLEIQELDEELDEGPDEPREIVGQEDNEENNEQTTNGQDYESTTNSEIPEQLFDEGRERKAEENKSTGKRITRARAIKATTSPPRRSLRSSGISKRTTNRSIFSNYDQDITKTSMASSVPKKRKKEQDVYEFRSDPDSEDDTLEHDVMHSVRAANARISSGPLILEPAPRRYEEDEDEGAASVEKQSTGKKVPPLRISLKTQHTDEDQIDRSAGRKHRGRPGKRKAAQAATVANAAAAAAEQGAGGDGDAPRMTRSKVRQSGRKLADTDATGRRRQRIRPTEPAVAEGELDGDDEDDDDVHFLEEVIEVNDDNLNESGPLTLASTPRVRNTQSALFPKPMRVKTIRGQNIVRMIYKDHPQRGVHKLRSAILLRWKQEKQRKKRVPQRPISETEKNYLENVSAKKMKQIIEQLHNLPHEDMPEDCPEKMMDLWKAQEMKRWRLIFRIKSATMRAQMTIERNFKRVREMRWQRRHGNCLKPFTSVRIISERNIHNPSVLETRNKVTNLPTEEDMQKEADKLLEETAKQFWHEAVCLQWQQFSDWQYEGRRRKVSKKYYTKEAADVFVPGIFDHCEPLQIKF